MAQADGLRDRCRLRAKRTPESLPQVRNRTRRGQQNPPASPFLPTSPATRMQPSASSVATAAARAGCERAWYRCARGAGRTPEIGPRARGRIPARTRRARVMNPSAQARRRHCFRPPLPGGVRGRAGRTRARAGSVPRPPRRGHIVGPTHCQPSEQVVVAQLAIRELAQERVRDVGVGGGCWRLTSEPVGEPASLFDIAIGRLDPGRASTVREWSCVRRRWENG